MAEAILYGTSRTDDEKFLWEVAFNNSTFINYITSVPTLIDYTGYELYVPDNEYSNRIDFGTASFPSCSGYIGAHAFDGCRNMTSINFGYYDYSFTDIQYIGESAFSNCQKLASIKFSVPRNISAYAFKALYKLSSFYMQYATNSDAELTKIDIGSHAFELCTSTNFRPTIPHVRSIGEYAFYECNRASIFNVGYSFCNHVGYRAFYNCGFMSSLELNIYGTYSSNSRNDKLVIEDEAFYGCTNLSSVTLCNAVHIGKQAFKNLSNLYSFSISLPYGISSLSTIVDYMTYIDEEAFYGCSSLRLYNYQISYANLIGERAFYGCTSLSYTPGYYLCSNVSKDAFYGCTLSSIILNLYGYEIFSKSGVSISCTVDKDAFRGLDNLQHISINKIYTIYDNMFSGMSKLSDIRINYISGYYSSYIQFPDEQIDIGSHAFENCYSLYTAYASILHNIGDYAFVGCSSLTDIHIGECLCTKIGKSAFKNCTNNVLAMVFNTYWSAYGNLMFSNFLYIDDYAFENCGVRNLYLYGVNYIGSNILKSCYSLQSLYIHLASDNVEIPNDTIIDTAGQLTYLSIVSGSYSIPESFAYQFPNLSSVNMSCCTKVGSSAFYSNTNLRYISLSTGSVTIDDYAFSFCFNLSTIYAGFQKVGSHAFENCQRLNSIIGGVYDNVDVGDYAFANCFSLATFTIGIRSVGSHAFELANLANLGGPACCTSIGAFAFHNCRFSIFYQGYNSLSYIGEHAFENATNLKSIILSNVSSVPYLESIDAFHSIHSEYIILVSQALYSDFVNHSVWGLISDHISIYTT